MKLCKLPPSRKHCWRRISFLAGVYPDAGSRRKGTGVCPFYIIKGLIKITHSSSQPAWEGCYLFLSAMELRHSVALRASPEAMQLVDG